MVDHLVGVAQSLAVLVNVITKVAKGNLLAIFELASVLKNFQSFDFPALKLELAGLRDTDRFLIDEAFAGALDIADPLLHTRIASAETAVDELLEAVILAGGAVTKIRTLIGV